MRIIGGCVRGFPLHSPKGLKTRPTADRVREAIFNVLCQELYGASILDIFSGTGALSLEALSRGARNAVLIEKSKEALQSIQQNIAKTGMQEKCSVHFGDCRKILPNLKGPFHIVFLDPPYDKGWLAEVAPYLAKEGFLAKDAVLVVETKAKKQEELPLNGFVMQKSAVYGDTAVNYYRRMKEDNLDG